MKILITGGAGFIGSHIAEHFHRQAQVVVLDNLRSGYRHNLAGLDVDFIEGSICDRALVEQAMYGVDFVFHLAAMVSVPESMQNPIECNELNVCGLLNVLEAAAAANVKKLVFSSSAAIYGDDPVLPKHEGLRPEPRSPYAITKLDGEYYCRLFTAESRLATVALRYFNVFGPRQDPRSAYAAAVPIFIDRALRNQPITIYGDGGQTRDFIYVKDVVAANVHAALTPDCSGVYNVANGGTITIRELAEMIVALTGSQSTFQFGAERPGDIRHSRAAIERIVATQFTPSWNFDQSLRQTIDYFAQTRRAPQVMA